MARRLIVCAGHSDVVGKDRGVATPFGVEGVEAVLFRDLIIHAATTLGFEVITDANSNILIETMRWLRGFGVAPSDIAIEIHFNAGGGNGVEALIPGDFTATEKNIAESLCGIVADKMTLYNRGVKKENEGAHSRLGWMRIPCENILLEVCFMDHKVDMQLYRAYKERTALAIASYLKSLI